MKSFKNMHQKYARKKHICNKLLCSNNDLQEGLPLVMKQAKPKYQMNKMTNEETSHAGYVEKNKMGSVKRNNTCVTKHKHDKGEREPESDNG
jgi:demethoxyubiquinone hydroxylase (CLK1/Coq7/Cat5 family)